MLIGGLNNAHIIEPELITPRFISGVAGIQWLGAACVALTLYTEEVSVITGVRELRLVDKQIWDASQLMEAKQVVKRFFEKQRGIAIGAH